MVLGCLQFSSPAWRMAVMLRAAPRPLFMRNSWCSHCGQVGLAAGNPNLLPLK